jgi:HPt (histidine-containing phosphotransfer) domain-containing protein
MALVKRVDDRRAAGNDTGRTRRFRRGRGGSIIPGMRMDGHDTEPLLDPGALEAMRGLEGDSGGDLVTELVALFEAQLSDTVSLLESALAEESRSSLARVSHQLKGFALTVGAPRLARLASQLELAAEELSDEAAGAAVATLAACYRETAPALRAAYLE